VGKDIPRDFGILSEVALKRGNLAEAELWAKRSVAADGSSPSSHRRLAEVYGAEGLATEARAEAHIASVIDVASEPAVR
jgi:Tfp pilus assembly protein PilF